MKRKIIYCEIYRARYQNVIYVEFDDGTYYDGIGIYDPTVVHYTENEFIGLTIDQAIKLMIQRDESCGIR